MLSYFVMSDVSHGSANRRSAMAFGLVMAAIGLSVPGCASPENAAESKLDPISPEKDTAISIERFFPIGIRYFVEPIYPKSSEEIRKHVAEDFRRFRNWGFNCVVLEQVEDDRLSAFIKEATRKNLRVISSSRALFHYIRFAELPTGAASAKALAEDYLAAVGRDPAVLMHLLPAELSEDAEERAKLITEHLRRMDPKRKVLRLRPVRLAGLGTDWPSLDSDQDPVRQTADLAPMTRANLWLSRYIDLLSRQIDEVPVEQRFLMLPTSGPWDLGELAPEWWMHLYHLCLAIGWTDGVIFQRYRSLPTGTSGLLDAQRSVSTRQAAVLKRLTAEVAKWGPMLDGTEVIARSSGTDPASIHSVYLSNGRRRLLLVYNRSYETFAKEKISILPGLETRPVSRAIDLKNGDRHFREGDRLQISLRLKPAQARLYELF